MLQQTLLSVCNPSEFLLHPGTNSREEKGNCTLHNVYTYFEFKVIIAVSLIGRCFLHDTVRLRETRNCDAKGSTTGTDPVSN